MVTLERFPSVLLLFSAGYAIVRTIWPRRRDVGASPRVWQLAAAASVVAVASYFVRFAVPLGEEVWRLALGQSPAWLVGFTLGALGAERGWYRRIDPVIARRMRQAAWTAVAACTVLLSVAMAMGADMDDFTGGGTWQSAAIAIIEGVLVVAMSLWLLDLFRRRFDHQSRPAHQMSRAAYAAFVVHQLVLVGLVLATRKVPWPPEIEYPTVAVIGVVGSFGLGSLVMRIPGVSRVV